MIIAVIALDKAIPAIQKTFSNQSCIGIDFEYYSDAVEILNSIETRGFYLNKLVIVTSLFETWGHAEKQQYAQRLADICDKMPETAEIYIVDSKHLLSMEYANILNVYPQVIYQSQQIHVSELFNIITGNIQRVEADNIDNTVKPKGILGRLFGNKSTVVSSNQEAQPLEENQDASLFSDSDIVSARDKAPDKQQSNEELFDAFANDLKTSEEKVAVINEQISEPSDLPLFIEPDDKEEQSAKQELQDSYDQSEPQVLPEKESQPKTKKQDAKHRHTPIQRLGKNKTSDLSYVDIFRKRTKIILCTGERRSGVSTALSNLAQQAATDGLSVLIVDLDIERKGQAINFPFDADEEDVILSYSLYRALNTPKNIDDCVLTLEENLDFLGTALSVSDNTNIFKVATNESIQLMLTASLAKYDLIFVDCPYDFLTKYPCLVALSNIIIHSMMTDYRSIINTLNCITPDDFDSDMTYNLYLSKVMFLLNNYSQHYWGATEITEANLTKYMEDLTGESFYSNLAVLGRIPSFADYDRYMNDGSLFVSNSNYVGIFKELLDALATRG